MSNIILQNPHPARDAKTLRAETGSRLTAMRETIHDIIHFAPRALFSAWGFNGAALVRARRGRRSDLSGWFSNLCFNGAALVRARRRFVTIYRSKCKQECFTDWRIQFIHIYMLTRSRFQTQSVASWKTPLTQKSQRGFINGAMAEWPNAAVFKTAEAASNSSEGSNPSRAAQSVAGVEPNEN